ncbi:Subunit of the glycosylphosphatidylinositol transamidase complex-like protein [Friedmanniomyces endolithicus]|uniref:Subunit of the glycosylphosphatidylinositol transamidase complex-like protein n=1 Tax=Friedmanniomyces endolithicus TaxID=329885 RepID=A0AAN6R313_9PEZI|nr:Subunit of the glycosylphosphatidylinositol transamidase complex-like protein [Friedmanniomyces endolithicus]KAK1010769.1 Subunit of the glycosylphosphatidylinositol transamidase complex-like protein [Friedmanniomyces endolithicus]KAK1016367.1 Subunit of the glycosylphosphatidylinositol transamidase complex-like protein [Friedmanniomyces endolithicus]KAK1054762.1 Subunit of the glycosylphosphatidylinositol transamidase complex-like protein [Friedmanniomyces endolithicus]
MKLAQLLALPATLISAVLAIPEYSEHLHLRPLPNGYLYAGFNFTASTSLSAYESQHFRYFPRSLGQILQHSDTRELHLRFALGRWDDESWGSRPRDGKREGGTGVEIWSWLDSGGGKPAVEERWSSLVNSLSGLFCASLNFIDGTKTTRPVLSFEPEGTHRGGGNGMELLHGTLPHEVVCTENLTPFLKLLPCKGKAGISSLLDGHKVFDANWQTMSIDVRPICGLGGDCRLEIQQTVDIVLDIKRSMRPRNDPIPRPRPVEELECDESKSYHASDTCYPKRKEGEMAWSLSKIFGTPVRGSCHVADGDESHDISLEVSPDRAVEVSHGGSNDTLASHEQNQLVRTMRLPDSARQHTDISLPQHIFQDSPHQNRPTLYASRQITGCGQERGGMHTVLHNPHTHQQRIVYLESLPWFLRPYMHTLKVLTHPTNSHDRPTIPLKPDQMYYTPALDRKRGTHLELLLTIPAQSTVELTYDFDKAILRYTEYPPDANRGFDVAPAIIRVLPSTHNTHNTSTAGNEIGQDSYFRTTSLLLPLPTPDFSMPYNVIILTSTVIALGFGSIFNLLVRRFVLAEEVPRSAVAVRVAGVLGKVRGVVGSLKGRLRGGGQGRGGGGVAVGVNGVAAEGDGGMNGVSSVVESRKER